MPIKKYNHALVLSLYDQGFSYREIADRIGTNEDGVHRILQYHPSHPKRDMHLQKQGEKHNRAKLTEAQAIEIIELRNNGETYAYIAELYNVSSATPRYIYNGLSWPHLQHHVKPVIKKKKREKKIATKKSLHTHINYPTALCQTCGMALPCGCMEPKQIKNSK